MAQEDAVKSATLTERGQLNVQASTVKIHLLTLQGSLKARVTRAKTGAPVSGLAINFRSGSAAIEACTAFTDPEGIAQCSAGTQLSPAFILDLIAAGYDAVFDGNAEFQPASGHGSQQVIP
jgi:hypothetical protein